MMPIVAKQVVLCLLLAGTAIVCSATETGSQPNNFVVKSDEPKANETRVCDTRPCSKLEYYDKLKQKCRDFPGGGILVIMDHSTKCAHGDSGLHTFSRRDYYYVCHPEGVMIGLCPESTVFSDTEKRCIMQTSNQPSTIKVHDESRNCNIVVPDCNGVGLFPIPSNCSFYFKCQEHNYDFYQYIYQCPPGKVFHPDLLRCSSSNKCYDGHEDILNNFNKDYFSECHILGLFRTAKDCTLYYRCVPNMDGSFYQIRYECPYKMYYNIEKEICEPELYRNCDYIPHERIIEDYKIKHSLEGSTLAAYPTTVISAINTQITSTIPTYYDTTLPMDVTGTISLVQELDEKLITTEQVPDSTMKIPDDPLPGPETFPANNNEVLYDEYGETTDINGRNTSLEDLPYTNMAAMSQKSYATEESVIYHDEFDRENKITHESEARDEPLDIRDTESQPIENVEASTRPDGNNFLPATEVAPEQPEDGLTAKTRPGYDEMEWDSGAWKLPNRSKSKDSPGTESVTESTATEWPDHYSADLSPSNPYSTLEGQAECESLSQITEYDGITSSYATVEPYRQQISTNSEGFEEHINEFTDSINSTISSMREHRGSLDPDQNTVEAAEPSNAFNINCNADEDGEIVCNGQKLSVNGHLEILGYRLKLTKWKDAPAERWTEPGPTINIHLSLQHPFNYLFEAIATEYRTSFSYDYAFTTTPNSTVDNFYEEDTETD